MYCLLLLLLLSIRAAEYEADAIGIHLLAKACYDPDANITMLQKLEKAQEKQGAEVPPELLSTHPLTQVRSSCGRYARIFLSP
jgi:predicted Zn-dependent protease